MQVILIDDSDIDNKVNTKLLKLARLTSDIQAFTDPEMALAHVTKEGPTWTAPRWILLDIQMPGVDGFGWLDRFRGLPESVQSMCRIYMLSASIDRQELQKPRSTPLLIASVERWAVAPQAALAPSPSRSCQHLHSAYRISSKGQTSLVLEASICLQQVRSPPLRWEVIPQRVWG